MAWFYKNCLTDTCNCNRGGDCECLCTSIAAYAHKCCQQGVTIHWRSPSVCREYAVTDTSVLIVPWSNICCQYSAVFHVYVFIPFRSCMLSPLLAWNFIKYLKYLSLFQPMIVNTIIKVCVSEDFFFSSLLSLLRANFDSL